MELLLDRSALLTKQKLEISKVDLGNEEIVYVRQMTGHERDVFEQSLIKEVKNEKGITEYKQTLEDFRAKLAVCTLCNEEGVALLLPTDYQMLSSCMSAFRLEKIVNEAQKLNKISEEDKEALLKNSEAAPDGNSNSGSAEN